MTLARIAYEGDNKYQLFEFIRLLLEQDVSFQVDFEEGEGRRTHWYLNGSSGTACNPGERDYDIIKEAWHAVQYKKLKGTAKNKATDIDLSDEDGALAQHAKGVLHTSIIAATYYAEFGADCPTQHEIALSQDMEIHEE